MTINYSTVIIKGIKYRRIELPKLSIEDQKKLEEAMPKLKPKEYLKLRDSLPGTLQLIDNQ